MGPLIKLILLNVITYLILKFVVPNIPGSAPLPASLVFLYLIADDVGVSYPCHGERRIQRRILGTASTLPDGRGYRRAASIALGRLDFVSFTGRLANL